MNEENGHHHNHDHEHEKHHVTLNQEQLKTLIPYLKKHNLDHVGDLKKWYQQAAESGFNDIATEFGKIIELSEKIDRHFTSASEIIEKRG